VADHAGSAFECFPDKHAAELSDDITSGTAKVKLFSINETIFSRRGAETLRKAGVLFRFQTKDFNLKRAFDTEEADERLITAD